MESAGEIEPSVDTVRIGILCEFYQEGIGIHKYCHYILVLNFMRGTVST